MVKDFGAPCAEKVCFKTAANLARTDQLYFQSPKTKRISDIFSKTFGLVPKSTKAAIGYAKVANTKQLDMSSVEHFIDDLVRADGSG